MGIPAKSRHASFGLALALALAAYFLAACSAPDGGSVASPTAGSLIAQWVAYFDSTGDIDQVSSEQREVLEASAKPGELSYSDVTGLIGLVFECVEQQGLQAQWRDPLEDYGFAVPAYSVTESAALGSEASQAVIDGCTERFSALAEQFYIWQPKNAAIGNANWTREDRAQMMTCLLDNGVQIDDDATRTEIEQAALLLNQPSGPPDNPVFGINCFPER